MAQSRLCVKDQRLFLRVAEKSDYESVLRFLRKHFYPFDTFGAEGVSNAQSHEDEENEMRNLDSGASVLAISDDDKKELIGVSLAGRFREKDCRENLKNLQKLSRQRGYPDNLNGVIFIEEMKLRSMVCQRFNVEEACYTAVMSIHQDYRRLSLSNILMKKNLECAAKLGYSVAFGMCISDIGHIFGRSINFQPIYEVKFVDYKDYRGLNVFSHYPQEAKASVVVKIMK